jgi:uncharacterized protein (TIGR02246 family)
MEVQNELKIENLYEQLIESWNRQDARAFAELFATGGSTVGFDGSQMNGQEEIFRELDKIFRAHKTASYVTIIREIRNLGGGVVLLRAVAGMIPQGKTDIKPDVNAIQSLVAYPEQGHFKIALFQNTPAAFHNRKELGEALTRELQLEAERQQKENSL